MKKFEYFMLPVNAKGLFANRGKHDEVTLAKMNELGSEGWELVGMTGNASLEGFISMVFKRELNL
jgi:hypothetical protein